MTDTRFLVSKPTTGRVGVRTNEQPDPFGQVRRHSMTPGDVDQTRRDSFGWWL